MATERQYDRFELYSIHGLLLGSYATQVEAERHLGVAYHSLCIIGVRPGGKREIVLEREEMHG